MRQEEAVNGQFLPGNSKCF